MEQRYKLIEFEGEHYLADLDYHKLFLADEMSQEVFELFESQTEEQIVLALSDRYPEQDINNCIQWFHQLFERSPIKSLEQPQLKIFAPTPYSSRSRLKSQTLGASVAHIEFLKALSKYAQIHVTQEFDGIDNMVLIPFNPNDRASASMIIKEKYDGVLLSYLDNFEMMPFLSYLYTPVVLPVYTARGDNGRIANGMLRWYASMRSFDAFMVLSQPTIDLYSTFIQDTSLFHIVPCGVDTEFFHPMNKETAKGKVAKLLNIPEISQKQIVGYVSRFQVEKGAGIFVDIAKLMPDTMFLAVGTISDPDHHNFPPNLIHIGVRPREELPVLYSAFDVFCFPSIACSEEFGLVVLEAMACGTVPVVSSYDGPKYFVKDAGVIVEATTYDRDLADLGCGISAYDFAESITDLLHNDLNRQAMAEKARQYALELTWDNSARCLLQLFQKLNLKKRLIKRANHLPVGFSLSRSPDGNVRPKSIIINAAKEHNAPLVGWLYDTSIEEGIALALLQNHNMREIEAILIMVCHQSIRRLTMPKTPKSRAFYVVTLRSGAKQNDLKEFLLREWIPATRATQGCISVEMWEDHYGRAGYMILELWENKQIHFQNVSKLWGEEKKDVFQKLGQYGIMESNWGGEIINE